jgi:hypothetical protein
MSRAVRHLAAVAALSLAWTLAPALASADDRPKDETPSEKIRKALDQPIDLELKESSLAKVIARFHEKTKLDIAIDRTGVLLGTMGIDPNADMPQPVEAKFKGTKVRDALRKVFEPYGLAPFIIDDAVLLTGEETGLMKQLRQRVDVDVDDVPLSAALKQLGRRKAVNLVVDQKAKKEAERKVSLRVEDVAMDTAVRLLAEQAGLKAARIDNVLYVTTPEQAMAIAAENRANVPNYGPYGPYWGPYGLPGTAGVLGGAVGVIGGAGLGGIAGLGGGAGFVGLGGGGGITGVPQRVLPPPPPVPVPKDEPPAKPLSQAPPRKPAVADGRPAAPLPVAVRPDLWAYSPGRPSAGARRCRRRCPSPEPRLS